MTLAVFYGLPVIQLVITYQKVSPPCNQTYGIESMGQRFLKFSHAGERAKTRLAETERKIGAGKTRTHFACKACVQVPGLTKFSWLSVKCVCACAGTTHLCMESGKVLSPGVEYQ